MRTKPQAATMGIGLFEAVWTAVFRIGGHGRKTVWTATLTRLGMMAVIVAILLGWGYIPEARAAEFTVTRADDPSPFHPGGEDICKPDDCSLREAVLAANKRGGADTIVLPGGAYSLTRPVPSFGDNGFAEVGDLDIYGDVSIVGRDGSVTIDGNGSTIRDRVFDIHGANVSMERLSIADGRAQPSDTNGDGEPDFARGGGIRVGENASLTLGEVALQSNKAESIGVGGAIYNAGNLTLVDVNVSLNDALGDFGSFSGGVHTEVGATTRLFDTTISANEAGFGGGLGAFGTTLVYRSAIDTNEAAFGGGLYASGPGSLTTMTNSTMAHNTAFQSGAAIRARDDSSIILGNATIARNTSNFDLNGQGNAAVSLHNGSSATLRNTILAANEDASPGQGDVPDCEAQGGAEITLAGYDLIGNRNGCNLTTPTGAEGNQIGDAADPIDPLVAGGLASNGGPTETLALLSGSPAIDVGDPTAQFGCASTDQRGAPRSDCDIGAYELVRCFGAAVNIVGANGPDILRGGSGDDAILALGGADRVFGGGGNDAVCGGEGNDKVYGQGGNDRIAGEGGNDTVYGGAGNDRLFGGPGKDRMFGGKGRDRTIGQGGRDFLNVRDGRGRDLANGGPGRDRCVSDRRDRTVSCP